jgi:hypothetical protein
MRRNILCTVAATALPALIPFTAHAQFERYEMLTAVSPTLVNTTNASETIEIKAGEFVEVESGKFDQSPFGAPYVHRANVFVQLPGHEIPLRYDYSARDEISLIGPASIWIELSVYDINPNDGIDVTDVPPRSPTLLTLEISGSAPEFLVPLTGVVIPADGGGPVEIRLESSIDMIEWTPTQPGVFGTSTERRFFRVRAIRQ